MPRHAEHGFALPLTLFILVLITLLLSAAFVRVGGELRVGQSGGDMADALTIAQSGISQYLNFYSAQGIAPPDITLKDVFFAAVPFVLMAFLTVAIIFFFPDVATWLPDKLE